MRTRGFSLIELMIVVAILGIVAAMAIPSLFISIEKARQRRTMGDIRAVAGAAEAYSVDYGFLPRIAKGNVSGLEGSLEPTYIRALPLVDGWNWPLEWDVDARGRVYTVFSRGRDNVGGVEAGGVTHRLTKSIVLTQGNFVQWPEGDQR